MSKVFYFFLFIGIYYPLTAQNQANTWYFGIQAGLDFNSENPTVLVDGALSTNEGCASISDSNGDILFYTNGVTVYNKLHQVMPNGNGLKGHASSTQSAIIVPKPDYPNLYYIFTVDELAGVYGLQYSEVDMSLNNGLGNITANKNILLTTPTAEKITAIKNPITNSFWVVSHKYYSDEFISYQVTNAGVNSTPVISAVGNYIGDLPNPLLDYLPNQRTIGQLKIHPMVKN